jgi:hypothetical protein
MNIRSAELLNQSLQNAADNIYRNRALAASVQEETQRNAVEQSFRNAMMQHYANIEEKQAESAGLQEQRLENEDNAVEKKYGVMQAVADQKDAQDRVMQGLQGLSLDQKMSPDQKTQYLRQSIDAMQPQAKAGFLQNPQINALYQGQGDWNAVAGFVRAHQTAATPKAFGAGKANAGNTADFDREASQTPQQIANATAQADPSVPKDADTGKPALPVTVNPATAQRMGILAGKLAAAGVPGPIPTAAGLIYGTNATVQPNLTPGVGADGTGTTTNSFTLTPGGISQDALANVQNASGGPDILKSFGLVPGTGNTAINANGIATGRPAIPVGAATYLKQNPKFAPQFDLKYGQGSAAQVLNGPNAKYNLAAGSVIGVESRSSECFSVFPTNGCIETLQAYILQYLMCVFSVS